MFPASLKGGCTAAGQLTCLCDGFLCCCPPGCSAAAKLRSIKAGFNDSVASCLRINRSYRLCPHGISLQCCAAKCTRVGVSRSLTRSLQCEFLCTKA